MTFEPLINAPLAVQLHVGFALPSVIVGTLVLFALRPGRWHKRLGYVWVTTMAGLALTGFFIPSEFGLLGPIGPLHLFSVLTLWSLWRGVSYARSRNFAAHRATFEGLWFGGIGAAGLMNFIPGRTINRTVLGAYWDLGWWVIGIGFLALATIWFSRNRSVFHSA